MSDIVVDLWGPRACFCLSPFKVERYSSDVPTPSAIRGCLASIYNKPSEFWWRIKCIEIMNPIRRISVKQNEVTVGASRTEPFDVNDFRTQRTTVYLRDVHYRVTAELVPHEGFSWAAVFAQAKRRIEKGQCFRQPYLGLSDCRCDFAPADMSLVPIDETRDFNYMTYDTHVPYTRTREESKFAKSLYHCRMEHGVIEVPDYDSAEVIKLPPGEMLYA